MARPTRKIARKTMLNLTISLTTVSSYCCVLDGPLFGSFGAFRSYFSGNSTLSHSGCSRRFSISLRRNSESLDRLSNRFTKFLLIDRSEEHTSELQSLTNLVCRLLLEKKK